MTKAETLPSLPLALNPEPCWEALVCAVQPGLETAAAAAAHTWGVYCVVRDMAVPRHACRDPRFEPTHRSRMALQAYGDGAYMGLVAGLCGRLSCDHGAETSTLWLEALGTPLPQRHPDTHHLIRALLQAWI